MKSSSFVGILTIFTLSYSAQAASADYNPYSEKGFQQSIEDDGLNEDDLEAFHFSCGDQDAEFVCDEVGGTWATIGELYGDRLPQFGYCEDVCLYGDDGECLVVVEAPPLGCGSQDVCICRFTFGAPIGVVVGSEAQFDESTVVSDETDFSSASSAGNGPSSQQSFSGGGCAAKATSPFGSIVFLLMMILSIICVKRGLFFQS